MALNVASKIGRVKMLNNKIKIRYHDKSSRYDFGNMKSWNQMEKNRKIEADKLKKYMVS